MKTAIMTDSNSGIFPEEGRRMGIFVLPMPVILEGKERYEGVDLKPKEFFTSLMNGADASTSQPSPGAVLVFYQGPCPIRYFLAQIFLKAGDLSVTILYLGAVRATGGIIVAVV